MSEQIKHAESLGNPQQLSLELLGPWYNYEPEVSPSDTSQAEDVPGKLEDVFRLPVSQYPDCRVHGVPQP